MSKEVKGAESEHEKQNQQKGKSTAVTEYSGGQVALTGLSGGLLGSADDTSIQAQAARLSDIRFQKAQRQSLARQIGQMQGNQRLQRVVKSSAQILQRQEKNAPLLAAKGDMPEEEFDYYAHVVPSIIRIAEERGITFEQAMFVVGQARTEQGLRDPSEHNFRIFNMQLTWEEMQKLKKSENEVFQAGVRVKWIDSIEFLGGKNVVRKSPFFVYDDLDTSINHYFDRLEERHKTALLVLKEPDSTALEFARKLKETRFATAKDYAAHVVKNYQTSVKEFKSWVTERVLHVEKDIFGTLWPSLEKTWKELNSLKEKYNNELDPDKKELIRKSVEECEVAIKDIEGRLKMQEEQAEKLKATLKKLENKADQ